MAECHNGIMTSVEPPPRTGYRDVYAVWILAAVAAVAIGMLTPADTRGAWVAVGWGACALVAFCIQLAPGRPDGFLVRTAASVVGAFIVMSLVGLGFGLSTLFAV